jgi:hypothetical protein
MRSIRGVTRATVPNKVAGKTSRTRMRRNCQFVAVTAIRVEKRARERERGILRRTLYQNVVAEKARRDQR